MCHVSSARALNKRRLRAVSGRAIMAATVVIALLLSPLIAAEASHHVTRIDEVLTSYNGDSSVQFIEMRMTFDNNNFVSGSKLTAFDASGAFVGVIYTVPADVSSGTDRPWLMGTAAFQTLTGLTPDFVIPASLPVSSGMICWGKPSDDTDPDTYVDCVAYGGYGGAVPALVGNPTPFDPVGHALLRTGDAFSHDNEADFGCGDPAVAENNSGVSATMPATAACPVCGNLLLEPGEQCESNADALCPGLCDASCSCGNICGNGTREPVEECDGADSSACPGLCQANCSCGPSGPLDKAGQQCVNMFVKMSSKMVSSYGKAASKCLRDFGNERTTDAPFTCVNADPLGRLAVSASKVDAVVDSFCGLSYAVDCPAPCESTDAGGISSLVDDLAEFKACLGCMNAAVSISDDASPLLKGLHGRLLDAATLATRSSDSTAAKCQSLVDKALEKLFTTKVRELSKCAKLALRDTAPPLGNACIGVDKRGVIARAVNKLLVILSKCTPPDVFDGGVCANSSTGDLQACLDRLSECQACTWGNVMLGSTVDCDLLDNGAADGSCN